MRIKNCPLFTYMKVIGDLDKSSLNKVIRDVGDRKTEKKSRWVTEERVDNNQVGDRERG